MAANVAVDAGNNGNTAAQQCSVDVRLTPSVTIADASASEGNDITFTVTLNRAVSGGLTVTPSFSAGGLTFQGWATQGLDYTANTAPLRFAGTAGEKETFTVATTEDTDIEANERFTVSLTVSGTSVTVTATDTATGTILNDDECAMCWWKIDVTGGTQYTGQTLGVEEGGTVELTLTQRVGGQRTLTYWTVQPTNHNGSADPAAAFVDYKHILNFGPIKSTLTFSGNGDSKTIRIPALLKSVWVSQGPMGRSRCGRTEPPRRASRQAAQARLFRCASALRVTRRPPRWTGWISPEAGLPARS